MVEACTGYKYVFVSEGKLVYFCSLQTEMEKKIPALIEKELKGSVEIREVFKLTGRRAAKVAGCYVLNGELARNDNIVVRRKRDIIYEGGFCSEYSEVNKDRCELEWLQKGLCCG